MAAVLDLDFQRVNSANARELGDFLCTLAANGDAAFFHPHPLTCQAALDIASHSGRDRYFVAIADQRVVGYGMLRGWDAGFKIPSLGIAIHPDFRGKGLGKRLMEFLHNEAQRSGAEKIRLTVEMNNPAIELYRQLGYQFTDHLETSLVGWLSLQEGSKSNDDGAHSHKR